MPKYQENPSVRFGGATARSPDDWATRFGPYGRERVSMDGASVSTRQRKGVRWWVCVPRRFRAPPGLLGPVEKP